MTDVIKHPSFECQKCRTVCTFCWLTDVNGNKHFRIWCEPCYRLYPKSVKKEDKQKYRLLSYDLPEYKTLIQRGLAEKRVKPDRVDRTPELAEVLSKMPYREYLKSPHWKELREKMLHRAKNKCQLCNRSGVLNVHHRTYERRGREWKSDLIVLCSECHRKFHNILPKEA